MALRLPKFARRSACSLIMAPGALYLRLPLFSGSGVHESDVVRFPTERELAFVVLMKTGSGRTAIGEFCTSTRFKVPHAELLCMALRLHEGIDLRN